jgi:hypothetical protein
MPGYCNLYESQKILRSPKNSKRLLWVGARSVSWRYLLDDIDRAGRQRIASPRTKQSALSVTSTAGRPLRTGAGWRLRLIRSMSPLEAKQEQIQRRNARRSALRRSAQRITAWRFRRPRVDAADPNGRGRSEICPH